MGSVDAPTLTLPRTRGREHDYAASFFAFSTASSMPPTM